MSQHAIRLALVLAAFATPLLGQLPLIHRFDGLSNGAQTGRDVANAGDLDQDGKDDYVVGGFDAPVRVFSGTTGQPILVIQPPVPGEAFGFAVEGRADLDGDGIPEIFVGAPAAFGPVPIYGGASGLLNDSGKVYVFDGATGTLLHTWMALDPVLGTVPLAGWGSCIADVGDIDGDGIDDLAIGAWSTVSQGTLGGASFVRLLSGATGAILHQWNAHGLFENFGFAICGLGDQDGDGVREIAVGAPNFSIDPLLKPVSGNGYLEVFSGASGLRLYTLTVPYDHDWYAYDLASAGDLDGDGRDDLLVACPIWGGPAAPGILAAPAPGLPGHLDLVSGVNGHLLRRHFVGTIGVMDLFGAACAAGCDLDGDGVGDYASGALMNDRVHVFSGADGHVLAQFHSPGGLAWFGRSLAMLDDASGDGFGELVIGANFEDTNGLIDNGRVDVVTVRGTRVYGAGLSASETIGVSWLPGAFGQTSTGSTVFQCGTPGAPGLLLGSLAPTLLQFGDVWVLVDTSILDTLLVPFNFDGFGRLVVPTLLDHPALSGLVIHAQVLALDPTVVGGVAYSPGIELLHR